MANSDNDNKTKNVNNVMDFFAKQGFNKHSNSNKKLVNSNGDTLEVIDNNTAIRFGNNNFGFAEIHNHTTESMKEIITKTFKEKDFYKALAKKPTAREKLNKQRTHGKETGRGSR